MTYLEYNMKVCLVLSTIPNPNSKNPFPTNGYTLSTPYLHISVIFKYIKYQYYYRISTILYYTYNTVPSTHFINTIYPSYILTICHSSTPHYIILVYFSN